MFFWHSTWPGAFDQGRSPDQARPAPSSLAAQPQLQLYSRPATPPRTPPQAASGLPPRSGLARPDGEDCHDLPDRPTSLPATPLFVDTGPAVDEQGWILNWRRLPFFEMSGDGAPVGSIPKFEDDEAERKSSLHTRLASKPRKRGPWALGPGLGELSAFPQRATLAS